MGKTNEQASAEVVRDRTTLRERQGNAQLLRPLHLTNGHAMG